jgi:molybdopterin converting factor small subunit
MSAEVKVASYLTQYTGGKEIIKVEGKSVRECLHNLVQKFPALQKLLFDKNNNLLAYFNVFVTGGAVAFTDKLDISVKDGDTLTLLFIIGGG